MTPWFLAALLLFQTKVRYGQDGQKTDPADFTVAVHVAASRLVKECSTDTKGSSCDWVLHLDTLIAGKKFELARDPGKAVLHPGDYKARIAKDKAKLPEELQQQYEILMSDGSVQRFDVVGQSE